MNTDIRHRSLPIGHEIQKNKTKYKIISFLGSGSFSKVYKCKVVNDGGVADIGSEVVLKEYFPELYSFRPNNSYQVMANDNSTGVFDIGQKAFVKEAKYLSSFKHENIVPVLEFFFKEDLSAFIVMPFITENTLAKVLNNSRSNQLSQEEIFKFLPQLLNALRCIHEKKYLHRDIKPENILIMNDWTPILIDFGVAKDSVASGTKTVHPFLTKGYAPPEQYTSQAGDGQQGHWTDIYALGATILTCITGTAPEESLARASARINNEPDPFLPTYNFIRKSRKISEGFLAALIGSLIIPYRERIQNVAEFESALSENPEKFEPLLAKVSGSPFDAPIYDTEKKSNPPKRQDSVKIERDPILSNLTDIPEVAGEEKKSKITGFFAVVCFVLLIHQIISFLYLPDIFDEDSLQVKLSEMSAVPFNAIFNYFILTTFIGLAGFMSLLLKQKSALLFFNLYFILLFIYNAFSLYFFCEHFSLNNFLRYAEYLGLQLLGILFLIIYLHKSEQVKETLA